MQISQLHSSSNRETKALTSYSIYPHAVTIKIAWGPHSWGLNNSQFSWACTRAAVKKCMLIATVCTAVYRSLIFCYPIHYVCGLLHYSATQPLLITQLRNWLLDHFIYSNCFFASFQSCISHLSSGCILLILWIHAPVFSVVPNLVINTSCCCSTITTEVTGHFSTYRM